MLLLSVVLRSWGFSVYVKLVLDVAPGLLPFCALWCWLQFGEGAPSHCSLGDTLPRAGRWQCCAPVWQPVQHLVAFPQIKHGPCGLKFLILKLFKSRKRTESLKGNCWV